jgi:dephospho-CoA kinase
MQTSMQETADRQPYFIGLTGNIATGKSTALAFLAGKGAHIADADKLAHRTMEPDGPAYEKVLAAFGPEIADENGLIDRGKLGAIVFADPEALKRLEAIVHPATFELLRWDVMQSDAKVVVIEAIKLLESGNLMSLSDEVWVVTSSPETQLKRLVEERGMDEDEARRRMALQAPQEDKVARADVVIVNDGSLEDLYAQLEEAWGQVEKKLASPRFTDG